MIVGDAIAATNVERFSKILDAIFLQVCHAESWCAPALEMTVEQALDFILGTFAEASPSLAEETANLAPLIQIIESEALTNSASASRINGGFRIETPPIDGWRRMVLLSHEVSHVLHMQRPEYEATSDLWREVVAFLGELEFVDNCRRNERLSAPVARGLQSLYDAIYFGPSNRRLQTAMETGALTGHDALYPIARCCAHELRHHRGVQSFGAALGLTPLSMDGIVDHAISFAERRLTDIFAHIDPIDPKQAIGQTLFRSLYETGLKATVREAADLRLGNNLQAYVSLPQNDDDIQPIQPGETYAWRRIFRELTDALACLSRSSYHARLDFQRFFRREVLPPLIHRQVIFERDHFPPRAFLSWAWLNDETIDSLLKSGRVLGPQEWHVGSKLFINDIYMEKGRTAAFMKHLRTTPLARNAKSAIAISRNADGSPAKIRNLPLARF